MSPVGVGGVLHSHFTDEDMMTFRVLSNLTMVTQVVFDPESSESVFMELGFLGREPSVGHFSEGLFLHFLEHG